MRMVSGRGVILGALAVMGVAGMGTGASALEDKAGEKEAIKACEKSICEMALKKEASGPDLACSLSKTWAKDKLKEGSEKRKLSWSFGDARCGIDFTLPRATMVSAMTQATHTLEFKPETAKCEIEREKEVTTVNVTLQPKITFKDGKAEKVWLNVTSIEAPAVVKGAIWTAAQVEDTIGLFHGDLIKEINELLHEKCAQRYSAAK